MSGFSPDFGRADVRVSPNFGNRRDGLRPELLVLHYTGMESSDAAEAWLCNPESEVSCHYIVHEDGRVVQMVREADRAWHAGEGSWHGAVDVNSRSTGIEIANGGHAFELPEFPQSQIEAVIALCRDICARHAILPCSVLAHSDIAPGRKIDPGEKFPWRQLYEAGVGHFVEPSMDASGPTFAKRDEGSGVEELQSMLAIYGYGVEITGIFDQLTKTVVQSFQLHFRQFRADGVADVGTRDTLRRLLASVPIINAT